MLCEDPDKPQEEVADKYRSTLSPEFADRNFAGHKAYRGKSLDGSHMVEDEDKWDTEAFPKAYTMRSSAFWK